MYGCRQSLTSLLGLCCLQVVTELRITLQTETGPASERPSRVLFQSWLERASLTKSLAAKQEAKERDTGNSSDAPGRIEAGGLENILPLEFLQPDDKKQLALLQDHLAGEPEVVLHWLTKHVFPSVMKNQLTKLTSTGMDLGSDMLFSVRLGFSGTPSDLLPKQLKPCVYQKGSDAKILRLLTATDHVDVERLASWNVHTLLKHVATAPKRFRCLIDTGALVTGLSNEEVAR